MLWYEHCIIRLPTTHDCLWLLLVVMTTKVTDVGLTKWFRMKHKVLRRFEWAKSKMDGINTERPSHTSGLLRYSRNFKRFGFRDKYLNYSEAHSLQSAVSWTREPLNLPINPSVKTKLIWELLETGRKGDFAVRKEIMTWWRLKQLNWKGNEENIHIWRVMLMTSTVMTNKFTMSRIFNIKNMVDHYRPIGNRSIVMTNVRNMLITRKSILIQELLHK